MNADDEVARRKSDHLKVVLSGAGAAHGKTTGFETLQFEHCALPECNLDEIDVSVAFLGRRLRAPLLISSMTGGPERAAAINRHLAEAAEAHQIAFAVGSQRIAIEGGPGNGIGKAIRAAAPTIPIYANFGAAQIALGYGRDEAMRALEMIAGDALIIHLNPLQEAVQNFGDHKWGHVLRGIETIVRAIDVPIIVKEVGFGISAQMALKLEACGVASVDVAGAGGTNWALVEGGRAANASDRAIAGAFADWGIPTARAIADVRAACPDLPLIGSGGVKSGVDVAKAIRLGADVVGQAAGLLEAALVSTDAVHEALRIVIDQLRISCFCTGSRDLAVLRHAPVVQCQPFF